MRRLRVRPLLIGLLIVLAGCATKPMLVVPKAIDQNGIAPISTWAGTPVTVQDGRQERPLRVSMVDAGLTWDSYSTAVVQETQRAMLRALGPARPDAAAELRVTIQQHDVRFTSPNWIGETVIEAALIRSGQPTGQRWIARGYDSRWNWWGLGSAADASQKAFELAIQDLLRQLALTRPPSP